MITSFEHFTEQKTGFVTQKECKVRSNSKKSHSRDHSQWCFIG
jgi:hypothetical protein